MRSRARACAPTRGVPACRARAHNARTHDARLEKRAREAARPGCLNWLSGSIDNPATHKQRGARPLFASLRMVESDE